MPSKQVTGAFGFGAPRNTPAEIVDKLNMDFRSAQPCRRFENRPHPFDPSYGLERQV